MTSPATERVADRSPQDKAPPSGRRGWTFLTNHAHVLVAVAADPDIRVEDIAAQVGITRRAALLILRDLQDDGYLARERRGRRTHYTVARHRRFRHPAAAQHEVDELLGIFSDLEAPVGS